MRHLPAGHLSYRKCLNRSETELFGTLNETGVHALLFATFVTFLTGCGGPEPATLIFRSVEASACQDGIAPKAAFYVSELTLLDGSKIGQLPGPGESSEVALIELAPCNPSAEFGLPVTLPQQAPAGVRFTVGVPEHLNHAEPTRAQPPLDRSDMFWTWRMGYKFLALDGQDFAFHLGSTGCVSPVPIRPPAEPCKNSNRLTVTLPSFDWDNSVIGVDFAGLLAVLEGGARCTGDYSPESCIEAFAELGLDPDSGQCGAGCAQELFAAIEKR